MGDPVVKPWRRYVPKTRCRHCKFGPELVPCPALPYRKCLCFAVPPVTWGTGWDCMCNRVFRDDRPTIFHCELDLGVLMMLRYCGMPYLLHRSSFALLEDRPC